MENYEYKSMPDSMADALEKIKAEQYAEYRSRSIGQFVSDHSGGEDNNVPTSIDLEAWKPCDVCEEYKAILFGGYRTFEDAAGIHRISKPNISGGARFCPCCGRPLIPGAWDELKSRLRGE